MLQPSDFLFGIVTGWYARASVGPGGSGGAEGGGEGARDDLLHDLAGPGVDLRDAEVGPRPGDRVLVHVAVPAMQLQALVRDLLGALGAPQLRHRDGRDVELLLEVQADALVEERAGHPG